MGEVKIFPGLYEEVVSKADTAIVNAILLTLRRHKDKGLFKTQERHFLGVSTDLSDIFSFFQQIPNLNSLSYIVVARFSCADQNFTESIISFYLSFYSRSNNKEKIVYQYAWLTQLEDPREIEKTIIPVFISTLALDENCNCNRPYFTNGFIQSENNLPPEVKNTYY